MKPSAVHRASPTRGTASATCGPSARWRKRLWRGCIDVGKLSRTRSICQSAMNDAPSPGGEGRDEGGQESNRSLCVASSPHELGSPGKKEIFRVVSLLGSALLVVIN